MGPQGRSIRRSVDSFQIVLVRHLLVHMIWTSFRNGGVVKHSGQRGRGIVKLCGSRGGVLDEDGDLLDEGLNGDVRAVANEVRDDAKVADLFEELVGRPVLPECVGEALAGKTRGVRNDVADAGSGRRYALEIGALRGAGSRQHGEGLSDLPVVHVDEVVAAADAEERDKALLSVRLPLPNSGRGIG